MPMRCRLRWIMKPRWLNRRCMRARCMLICSRRAHRTPRRMFTTRTGISQMIWRKMSRTKTWSVMALVAIWSRGARLMLIHRKAQ